MAWYVASIATGNAEAAAVCCAVGEDCTVVSVARGVTTAPAVTAGQGALAEGLDTGLAVEGRAGLSAAKVLRLEEASGGGACVGTVARWRG